jgi:hypothetical protein
MLKGLLKSSRGLPSLLVRVLHTDTGLWESRTVALECARRHSLLVAHRATTPGGVRALTLGNDLALASHFARRCVAAIYANWPPGQPLTLGGCRVVVDERGAGCGHRAVVEGGVWVPGGRRGEGAGVWVPGGRVGGGGGRV